MTVDKFLKRAKSLHVPTRMCVACGEKRDPSDLLRFVRNDTGALEPDRKRIKGGRGAYVCLKTACFEKALEKGRFSRALRGRVLCDRNAMLVVFEG